MNVIVGTLNNDNTITHHCNNCDREWTDRIVKPPCPNKCQSIYVTNSNEDEWHTNYCDICKTKLEDLEYGENIIAKSVYCPECNKIQIDEIPEHNQLKPNLYHLLLGVITIIILTL